MRASFYVAQSFGNLEIHTVFWRSNRSISNSRLGRSIHKQFSGLGHFPAFTSPDSFLVVPTFITPNTSLLFPACLIALTRLHLHHIEFPLVGPVPLPFPFLFAFPLDDLLLPPQVVQFLKIVNYDHYINF